MNHPQLLYRAECLSCNWVGTLKDSKAPAMDESDAHQAAEHADDDVVDLCNVVSWDERDPIPKA